MTALTSIAQAVGLAWSASISLYATVAFAGVAGRLGWIALPPGLQPLQNPWVIGAALVLTAVEVAAQLVPGIATAWEAAHAAVRPVASAALAVLTTWGDGPAVVVASALLGGGLAAATSATKLKVRSAIDISPEPASNALATGAELGTVASFGLLVWHHPWIALVVALLLLAVLFLVARTVWRALRRAAGWLASGAGQDGGP
jgi:hypothetical protein